MSTRIILHPKQLTMIETILADSDLYTYVVESGNWKNCGKNELKRFLSIIIQGRPLSEWFTGNDSKDGGFVDTARGYLNDTRKHYLTYRDEAIKG
jgi:hypothetical protein